MGASPALSLLSNTSRARRVAYLARPWQPAAPVHLSGSRGTGESNGFLVAKQRSIMLDMIRRRLQKMGDQEFEVHILNIRACDQIRSLIYCARAHESRPTVEK